MDLGGTEWLAGSEWTGVIAAPFLGSFAAAATRRYAQDLPFVGGRSACDACGAALRPWELVPLASWIALRGRCARCGAAIGWRPLLVEGIFLAVAMIAYWESSGGIFWISCLLGWILLGLALVDIETYLLPDLLTVPLIVIGMVVSAFFGREMFFDHLLAAAVGFLGLFAVARTYRALAGREGLGMGDAKLFAATGAWIGMAALPGALFIAAGAALVVELARRGLTGQGDRLRRVAFGPYLALATWIGWVFGPLVPAGS